MIWNRCKLCKNFRTCENIENVDDESFCIEYSNDFTTVLILLEELREAKKMIENSKRMNPQLIDFMVKNMGTLGDVMKNE